MNYVTDKEIALSGQYFPIILPITEKKDTSINKAYLLKILLFTQLDFV